MSMLSLLTKLGVSGALITASYGSIEDMVGGILDGVSVNAALADMRLVHGKLMEYYTANGAYPRTQPELINYLKDEFDTSIKIVLTDPWNNGYNFFTRKVEINSLGPDTKPFTGDDINIPYPNNVRRPNIK